MKPLPIRPLPLASEPLTDFLERLAAANGYELSVLRNALVNGQMPHPQGLSEALNGHRLPTFSGPADPRVHIPVESFGLKAGDFTHAHHRWCPLCIEDGAWIRPVWRLKVATICETHRVHLLQRCTACKAYGNMEAILQGTCDCGTRFAEIAVPADRKRLPLARALTTSLANQTVLELQGVTVTLTARQLVRMICYTGRLVEGPELSKPGQIQALEDIGVASHLSHGVTILLANWPNRFWRCLEHYVAASPQDASVRRVFGSLYHVLYKDLREPEYQFWRDAFESFLLEHWRGELCGRHRLFQEHTIAAHDNRGIAHVARLTGVSRERLKRMVHQDWLPAHRFTSSVKRQLITIDRTQLSKLIPGPGEYLDLRCIARLFGIERTRVRQLVATGVLLADLKPSWQRTDRWNFRRSEISRFLEQIRNASQSSPFNGPTTTLSHALRYWRLTATEFGALLLAATQAEIRFSIAPGSRLRDLLFCRIELHTWLEQHRISKTDWVSIAVAAKFLGLKQQVVYELVAKNLLVATLEQRDGFTIRRISLPSQERFRQQYVSLAELAAQQKTSPLALSKRIAAVPVTGPRIDGGRQYFYRRTDLPNDMPPSAVEHAALPGNLETQRRP